MIFLDSRSIPRRNAWLLASRLFWSSGHGLLQSLRPVESFEWSSSPTSGDSRMARSPDTQSAGKSHSSFADQQQVGLLLRYRGFLVRQARSRSSQVQLPERSKPAPRTRTFEPSRDTQKSKNQNSA